MGGLARRATLFSHLRTQIDAQKLLIVAGTHEFSKGKLVCSQPQAEILSTLYQTLNYDFLTISAASSTFFEQLKVPLPKHYTLGKQATFQQYETKHGKIGFIFFPELDALQTPSTQMLNDIEQLCTAKRKTVDLLVGISSWGYKNEKQYLHTKSEQRLDLLLGTGSGIELEGRFMADGQILWCRAASLGKSILKIEISNLHNQQTQKKEIQTQFLDLDDSIKSDASIEELISKVLNTNMPETIH